MGIFQSLKIFLHLLKDSSKIMAELEAQRARYLQLTTEEMAALPDEELFSAALSRAESKVDTCEDMLEGIRTLSQPQRVLYCINYLEAEVNNGGLCQFFVNSSRVTAPYISEYLGIIGAADHKNLFASFIGKYNIDLSDLSSFKIQCTRDFEKQMLRYPFDEYDDAFYELESLEIPLTAYIKQNLDAF